MVEHTFSDEAEFIYLESMRTCDNAMNIMSSTGEWQDNG